jgi:energy-coupling factor transport system ATP-binding protein
VAIVELRDLTYKYPITTAPALEAINLDIEEGEFVAAIGANGAGKSTLCYTLSGFIPHFFRGELAGSVLVNGINTLEASLGEIVLNVGLAFQNPFNQISGAKFTVFEEVAFGLENLGVPRADMQPRVTAALQLTGIEDLAERSPYALSGGQQQRVALASILVMQPKILALDEPTSQLDPIGTREVFEVIKSLSEQGMTILLAEHKVEWIAEFADRVIVLENGRLIDQGTPQEILSSPDLAHAGIGVSRYTLAANLANKHGLWLEGERYPITLSEAEDAFGKILAHPARTDQKLKGTSSGEN